MGGKTKQAQRTKNNVRPSSSGRSAEQLCGTVGAAGIAGGAALFPTLAAAAALDAGLPADFVLCFKKLNKKDPITKAKALQELTELVQRSEADDVAATLPSWARAYRALAVDRDRKVRELTQTCHGAIMRACGRRVAPVLKSLLPVWLTAQYDDAAPAMTRASRELHAMFPGSKLADAISFCKEEILTHLVDTLLDSNEILWKKAEEDEERASSCDRACAASLQGLRYVAACLPRAHDQWLWGRLQPLLDSAVYWKLAGARAGNVRAAWYGSAGALATRFGSQWGAAHGARALRLLLATKEPRNDPAAAAALWQALVTALQADPEWYERLEKKDALTRKLLETLENGGWGDARRLADTLPPLLALLPPPARTEHFYNSFFEACLKGFEKKNVASSASERAAWLDSLAECIRYVSVQSDGACVRAARAAVRGWAGAALAARNATARAAVARRTAAHFAKLLRHWMTLATPPARPTAGPAPAADTPLYVALVELSWRDLTDIMLGQYHELESAEAFDAEAFASLLDTHVLFLRTLKTSFAQAPKPRQKIKFEDEIKPTDDPSAPTNTSSIECVQSASGTGDSGAIGDVDGKEEPERMARYERDLASCVREIASRAVQLAAEKSASTAVARGLPPLLEQFASEQLLTQLGAAIGYCSPASIYHQLIRDWLTSPEHRSRPLLDLVFHIMRYLPDGDRDLIYDSFQQLGEEVSPWAVCISSQLPARGWAAARRWCSSDAAAAALRRAVAQAGNSDAHAAEIRAALLNLFSPPALLDTPTMTGVLQALSSELSVKPRVHTVCLAAQLAATLAVEDPPPGYEDVLIALFKLTLYEQSRDPSEPVPPESILEARAAWHEGLLSLSPARRDTLTNTMLQLRDHYLQQGNPDSLELPRIEHATTVCAYMVSPDAAADDVTAVIERACAAPRPRDVMTHALTHDLVAGRLVCVGGGEEGGTDESAALHRVVSSPATPLLPSSLRPLCRCVIARTTILRAMTRTHADGCELLAHKQIRGHLLDVMHDHAMLCELQDGYAFWPHYEDIVTTEHKLSALLSDMLSECPADVTRGIMTSLRTAAAERGYYWAVAYVIWRHKVKDVDDEDAPADEEISGDGFFHTLQAEALYAEKQSTTQSGEHEQHNIADEQDKSDERSVRALQLSALRALLAVLPTDAAPPPVHNAGAGALAAMDLVVDAHYQHPDYMLYDTDISSAPWSLVVWASTALRVSARSLRAAGWVAPPHHWDFATISLASILSSLRQTKHDWGSTKVAMLWWSAVELLETVVQFISRVPAECLRRQPSTHVAALPNEWADVFRADVTAHVYHVLLYVLESADSTHEMTSSAARTLSSLVRASRLVRWEHLTPPAKNDLPLPRLATAATTVLAMEIHHAYKYLAYCVLLAIADPLVLDDAEKLRAWAPAEGGDGDDEEEEDSERPRFLLQYYLEPLNTLLDQLELVLDGCEDDDSSSTLSPTNPAWSTSLGVLLLWDALTTSLSRGRSELAAQYRAGVRSARPAQRVIPAALCLLPRGLRTWAYAPGADTKPPLTGSASWFLESPVVNVDEPASSQTVCRLSCLALCRCVRGACGACARAWRGAACPRATRALARLVAVYVAPAAVHREMAEVTARAGAELPDAEVRVHAPAREVTCVVEVDDRPVELVVTLARDHPLTPPRVHSPAAPTRHAPAPPPHWLNVYLAYQDGSVLGALRMWARMVAARVEAAPVCYICYCRLHPAAGTLPAVPCRQCRNKFHNLCLRKWFASSNKSNCPLCRANF